MAAQQRYKLENDLDHFRDTVLPGAEVWVAWRDNIVLGFMALEGDLIDPLFVAMEALRKGVGTTEDEPDVVLLWLPGSNG